ncbi:AraC family transcriptional regulator [Bacterioplanes sanyensis]|uniref:AraC family transcriptional regulator n=1 Tax=Bacterioplanes sanyensis TaxID=1249553 RepID=A0A222FMZ8_9GAMM|nr:helix-turn-helix domain-containing protein [Bacterioplanes sanyensis]ASP39946.1 AraC family transcriptional regulator [Bacterioplanes sanyensis]
MLNTSLSRLRQRGPQQLVENRTVFFRQDVELSIYDTYAAASNVALAADEVLYCAMIQGRKEMHGPHARQRFVPHESYVLAPGQQVLIDFPEARMEQPTTCLTVSVDSQKIHQLCEQLEQQSPLPQDLGSWDEVRPQTWHSHHSRATQALLERIAASFLQADEDQDLVLSYGVDELLCRLLRQQGREFLLACAQRDPEQNSMTAVLHHMEQHLAEPLDIDQLCRISCMSRSKFYQSFRRLFHCSPNEYLLQQRLARAKQLLTQGRAVTRVAFDVGFQSVSHFSRRFHQCFGVSPSRFRQQAVA